jgi:hypothetical protein
MGQLGEMRLYNVIHFLLEHHSLQGEMGSYFLLSAGLIGKTKRNSNIKISVSLLKLLTSANLIYTVTQFSGSD